MKISRQVVLEKLKQGKTLRDIESETGASITSLRAHKYKLTKAGLWKGKQENKEGLQWTFNDLDQATEFWIERLNAAKRVPTLESQIDELNIKINTLNNQLAACRNEVVVLNDTIRERHERKMQYENAVSQGQIREPVGGLRR